MKLLIKEILKESFAMPPEMSKEKETALLLLKTYIERAIEFLKNNPTIKIGLEQKYFESGALSTPENALKHAERLSPGELVEFTNTLRSCGALMKNI